jgi:hypothetical protein
LKHNLQGVIVTKKKSAKKAGGERRQLIDTGAAKLYMKRKKDGTFKEGVEVGASLAADHRSKSKTTVKPGFGDQGDQKKPVAKPSRKTERPVMTWPLTVWS